MKAIIDCNSFYCSCERLFRPELDKEPVVVLSNNDGCVIARTDEVKALGIAMGAPFFQVREMLEQNNVAVFSSNYNLYGDLSRRVMDTLKQMAGEANIEVYSVDECFLDLEQFVSSDLHSLAMDLRKRVEQWTGIKVSVGIAPTKTLAKLANRMAKKDKDASQCIAVLDTDEKIIEALKMTKVGDLWGVGARYADKLCTLGLTTAWDLYNLSEEWVRKHLGGVVGVRLLKELHGEQAIMMKEELKTKKMIATTRMFGKTVTELNDIREAVATYTARAAEKLRRQKSAANMISVFLISQEKVDGPRFYHGPTVSQYYIMPQPTAMTNELTKAAVRMAEALYTEGKKYKKAGVMLSGLVPDTSIQGNLFLQNKSIGRFLMDMVDNINFSMRGNMVSLASAGTNRHWVMQQEHHSPRYTTRWEELYTVQ